MNKSSDSKQPKNAQLKIRAKSFIQTYQTDDLALKYEQHPAVQSSLDFLSSAQAFEMLEQDPYWPKWDHPWWHMLALKEMGLTHLIPTESLNALIQSLDTHWLKFFPRTEAELPKDCDPYRNIVCFCALGSLLQVLHACDVALSQAMPWVENWFERYLLPDGGYNCDDQAYRNKHPRSSFTSSVPMYEALLQLNPQRWKTIINQGLHYLENRAFCRSLSKNCVADPDWLKPGFPLFYEYDVLRGMQFALDAHIHYQHPIKEQALGYAFDHVLQSIKNQSFRSPSDYTSYSLRSENGRWNNATTQHFKLLDFLSQPAVQRQFIHQKMYCLCLDIVGLTF